jgi:poly(A) polymerase
MYRLRDAGFLAYLVGGGVRDIYLGKIPKDFDISTSAKPNEIRKIFRNSRIIGRRFRLVQVFFGGGKLVEVSTFRCRTDDDEPGDEASVLPSNNEFGDPAEDAFRRDLTINALFYEIESYTVIDYVGGVKDLQDKIVRLVGDPGRRITRDPVRMMRVIRHAARASFAIDAETWAAVVENKEMLNLCPDSRVRDELFKDLRGGACRAWAELAMDSGIFYVLFPFYRQVLLEHAEAESTRALLLNLLAVLDRLVAAGQTVPEEAIFSLLLIPLFQVDSELMAVQTQQAASALALVVRDRLQGYFSRLNIKRCTQDMVARALVTLPLMIAHEKEGSWPKWLARKSYFANGLQLFELYSEACGLKQVAEVAFPVEVVSTEVVTKPSFSGGGGSRGPAFAPGVRGGVFGFRKD